MAERKLIAGLDILKFMMAILIVAIHTEAVNEYEDLFQFVKPLLDMTVPVFFVVSSFFVFKNINLTPPSFVKYR